MQPMVEAGRFGANYPIAINSILRTTKRHRSKALQQWAAPPRTYGMSRTVELPRWAIAVHIACTSATTRRVTTLPLEPHLGRWLELSTLRKCLSVHTIDVVQVPFGHRESGRACQHLRFGIRDRLEQSYLSSPTVLASNFGQGGTLIETLQWLDMSMDLSAFAGQTIYLGLRFDAGDAFLQPVRRLLRRRYQHPHTNVLLNNDSQYFVATGFTEGPLSISRVGDLTGDGRPEFAVTTNQTTPLCKSTRARYELERWRQFVESIKSGDSQLVTRFEQR